jgi:hypothetical protein
MPSFTACTVDMPDEARTRVFPDFRQAIKPPNFSVLFVLASFRLMR